MDDQQLLTGKSSAFLNVGLVASVDEVVSLGTFQYNIWLMFLFYNHTLLL